MSARCTNQPPVKRPNKTSRVREYLTPAEVEKAIYAAHGLGGRLANRDVLPIMEAAITASHPSCSRIVHQQYSSTRGPTAPRR
jgi:hypothetical protein